MTALNLEQSAVVLSDAPNKLVVAGPGSGKTRTLCAAVKHEVNRGVDPAKIAVVTYTNAAADEMERRLKAEFGLKDRLGYVGTLHGFCLRLAREHHEALGLPERVTVIDDDQREAVMQSVMDEMGVKGKAKRALDAWELKPDLKDRPTAKEDLAAKEYRRQLTAAGLLDFQMILDAGLWFVRHGLATGWDCLFVDEFQDAADTDADFYEEFQCREKFLVGDSDQAIYGFRGGNVRRLLRLSGDPAWKTFLLETNYRSGATLCEHAQQLVMRNAGRVHKWTRAEWKGGRVGVRRCNTAGEELSYVLEEVRRLGARKTEVIEAREADGTPKLERPMVVHYDLYNDITVLARTNRLADAVAQHLSANGVPVRRSKERVLPADWRRTKLLLTVLDNPWSDFAVAAFLRTERPDDWKAQVKDAAKKMVGLNEFLGFPFGKGDTLAADVDLTRHGVSPESRERVHLARRDLSTHRPGWTIADLLLHLAEQDNTREEDGEGVTCTTMHGAKGREWRHVFVVGCEEGCVPSGRKGTDLEEERRLMYVAMTRAAETLTLTWCAERPQWRGDKVPPGPPEAKEPSRFIAESGLTEGAVSEPAEAVGRESVGREAASVESEKVGKVN